MKMCKMKSGICGLGVDGGSGGGGGVGSTGCTVGSSLRFSN